MSSRDGASRAIAILTAANTADELLDDDEFMNSLIGETDEEVSETVAALTGIALAAIDMSTNNHATDYLQALARKVDKLPEN